MSIEGSEYRKEDLLSAKVAGKSIVPFKKHQLREILRGSTLISHPFFLEP